MLENQLSRYGALSRVAPGVAPSARVFLVGDSDDTTYGIANLAAEFPPDRNGVTRVYSDIQTAVNACDTRGDVVLVAPYMTIDQEGVDTWDVAGVRVIGLGEGESRPTIRYDTGAASINLGANGVTIENFILLAGEDSIARALDLDTGFFGQRVRNCTFTSDSMTDDFRVMIRVGSKEAIIENNEFLARDTAGAGRAISLLGGDPDFLQIRNNYFYGQFDTVGDTTNGAAVIATDTTDTNDTNLSGLLIENNKIVSTDTAAAVIVRLQGGTFTVRGLATNNQIVSYDSTAADTAQVLWGDTGILALNNFFTDPDTATQQSIVGSTTAAVLHLDS